MQIYKKTLIAATLSMSLLGGFEAMAQEIERGNPFVAPSTWTEEQARQDEKTRIIFREMEPELKESIFKRMTETQSALEIKLRRRIDIVSENLNSGLQAIPRSGMADAASADSGEETKTDEVASFVIPEGSTFVACINKGALYRDNKNIIFKIPETDPQSIAMCAR